MQKWNFAPNPVYTKQDVINEETKDIIAIVYESKKNTQNKLEPFIKSNIKYVGISPVQDKETIKEDIFLVYDDNSSNKQWLYFVFPTLVKCLPGTQSFLSANHFTFCYDKSDKKKPCHFHSTYYLCVDKLYEIDYTSYHVKDFIPDSLLLPNDYNKIFTKHSKVKDFLIRLIEHPWRLQDAGGKHTSQATKRNTTKPSMIRNPEFCTLWQSKKFKGMTAFGIKKGTSYHWTIEFKHQGRYKPGVVYKAFAIITNANDDHETVLMQKLVILCPVNYGTL
jgi:hypothetical protein